MTWKKNPRKIFCQVYVLRGESLAVLSGNNAIHPEKTTTGGLKNLGNPMKRSHAEMATDMWEILGFKRALSIFPEPRHPRAFKQR